MAFCHCNNWSSDNSSECDLYEQFHRASLRHFFGSLEAMIGAVSEVNLVYVAIVGGPSAKANKMLGQLQILAASC